MSRFRERLLGAALLRTETYEEVEADRGATVQAMAVVILAAVAAGIGSIDNGGVAGIAKVTVAWLVGWYIWAYAAYFIGTRLLPDRDTVADHGELLRTIGFSCAPGLLQVLGLIPSIAGFVFAVCGVWILAAMVIAVRQALDYTSTTRAIAVCVIGFPIHALILAVTLLLLGPWPV
jgi:hypothetical protein